MNVTIRCALITGSILILGAVASLAAQNGVSAPRDKNSSATIFDEREAKARDLLKDARILGTNYLQVEQINNILDVGRVLAGWELHDTTYIHIDETAFSQSVTLTNVRKWHGKPDRVIAFAANDNAGPAKDAAAWGSVFLAFDKNSRLVGLGIPVAWAIRGARMSGIDKGPIEDLLTYLRKGEPKLPIPNKAGQSANLPPYTTDIEDLAGGSLAIENLTDKTISVGVRQGFRGKNMVIKPNETVRQSIPSGKYDIYFSTDASPDELLQGDSIFVDGTDVTIKYTKTPAGNYEIRKIR